MPGTRRHRFPILVVELAKSAPTRCTLAIRRDRPGLLSEERAGLGCRRSHPPSLPVSGLGSAFSGARSLGRRGERLPSFPTSRNAGPITILLGVRCSASTAWQGWHALRAKACPAATSLSCARTPADVTTRAAASAAIPFTRFMAAPACPQPIGMRLMHIKAHAIVARQFYIRLLRQRWRSH
jgi:hypothetical protein